MKVVTQLEIQEPIKTVHKAQWVRLMDVFWIGPLMIYGASKIDHPFHRMMLYIFGASTIVYNARNYLENQKRIGQFREF